MAIVLIDQQVSRVERKPMRINVVIDDALMREAMEVSGLKTKRATIEAALRHYVRFPRQADFHKLRGIGWEGDLDAMRRDD